MSTDAMREAEQVLTPKQYGTSMHWPYCRHHNCTGCLPPLPPLLGERPHFDLSLFRRPGGDHA